MPPSPTTLFNFCRKHKPQMGLGERWGLGVGVGLGQTVLIPDVHQSGLPWSCRKTACPLRLSEEALGNERQHLVGRGRGGGVLKQRAGLGGEERAEKCSGPSCQAAFSRRSCDTVENMIRRLTCSTKTCLFEIPPSVIKGAIALQNTIITARLGVALTH